jgi:hypothetical protein
MLYREIIAVCPQIHTKHTNTLCGQNVELLNVKLVVRPLDYKGLNLCYKNQPVDAVWENNRCLFSDPRRTLNYTVWENVELLNVEPGGT